MASTSQQRALFEDYEGFVEKFKPKKTTDDCYTPPEIYEVVLDYVVERYGIDRAKVVRPFWPGGDYEREDYPDGCAVVDNPPFSMLSKIIDFYQANEVPFFLFAPTLTCLSGRRHVLDVNHIVCHTNITYENGAKVNTSFVTNMDADGTVIESAPDLSDAINAKNAELLRSVKRHVPKYAYPDHVITAAKVNWFAAHHTPYRLNRRDCTPIAKLDAMGSKGIFGGGSAAERQGRSRTRRSRTRRSRTRRSRTRRSRTRRSDEMGAVRARAGAGEGARLARATPTPGNGRRCGGTWRR